MILCPYCMFPFTGAIATKKNTEDSFEVVRQCSHCEAILRFEITTLRKPKEKFRINLPKSARGEKQSGADEQPSGQ